MEDSIAQARIHSGPLELPAWKSVLNVISAVLLGFLFKRLMVDPMIRHGVLPLVIATIALALLLKEAVREFYSAEAQPSPPIRRSMTPPRAPRAAGHSARPRRRAAS